MGFAAYGLGKSSTSAPRPERRLWDRHSGDGSGSSMEALAEHTRRWASVPSCERYANVGQITLCTCFGETSDDHPVRFATIIGDVGQEVPTALPGAEVQLGSTFNTGGRRAGASETGGESAFLMFSVVGMLGSARVILNDSDVGEITASSATVIRGTAWSTQLIAIAGTQLKDGPGNRIVLRNVTDRFVIKNLICFYHQSD